jgi:hypothetical protein
MNTNRNLIKTLSLATCASALLLASSSQAAVYEVTVNTGSLVGNPSGPFSVDFQLNYGSGIGNTASVFGFNVSGVGTPSVYVGNPTGSIGSGFTLADNPSGPFNEIAQQFNPGSTLNFFVNLSQNGTGLTPDAFLFGIDDGSTYQIPTTSPDGITLASLQINPYLSNPAVTQATFSPFDPQYDGMTVTVTPVPETSTMAAGLFVLGFGAALLFRAIKPITQVA